MLALSYISISIILLLRCSLVSSAAEHTINVSLDGNDEECANNLTIPCKSLEKARLLDIYKENVTIKVLDNVELHLIFLVANTSNIHITGKFASNLSNLTFIQCGNEMAGFQIDSVCNFSFFHLAVRNCSFQYRRDEQIYFSVIIMESSNIAVRNVQFVNLWRTLLVLVDNQGQVLIENTSSYCYEQSNISYPSALSILQN